MRDTVRLGGLRVPSGVDLADGGTAATFARAAEAEGLESLWVVEHVVVPHTYTSRYPFHPSGKMGLTGEDDLPDPLIWLAFAAAATTTIRLGTGVMVLPIRNPVVLAKQAATLDRLSDGRFILGVGLGWLAEEFDAVGVPFRERGARMDDHLEAMAALWRPGATDFAGPFTRLQAVHSRPDPVRGGVPLVIGGASAAMVRRVVRHAEGMHVNRMPSDEVSRLRELVHREAAAVGRDPETIEFTGTAPDSMEEAVALVRAGVSRLVVSAWEGGVDDFRAKVSDYRQRLGEHVAIGAGAG